MDYYIWNKDAEEIEILQLYHFLKFVIIAVFVQNISLVAMTFMYKSNKSR